MNGASAVTPPCVAPRSPPDGRHQIPGGGPGPQAGPGRVQRLRVTPGTTQRSASWLVSQPLDFHFAELHDAGPGAGGAGAILQRDVAARMLAVAGAIDGLDAV